MALHCPECGFVNPEGSNYCQKCGSFLGAESSPGDTTVSYDVSSTGEMQPVEPVADQPGAVLVVRVGGRAGDSFDLSGDRITVGRGPDSDVFLDDVTVSRNHAVIVRRGDGLHIDDLGSLNGTYVNRQRIETHRLAGGDELQIGKFKLAYLER